MKTDKAQTLSCEDMKRVLDCAHQSNSRSTQNGLSRMGGTLSGKTKDRTSSTRLFGLSFGMPPVGVEPTLPKKLDFESSASANSATEACRSHTSVEAEQNYKAKASRCQQTLALNQMDSSDKLR